VGVRAWACARGRARVGVRAWATSNYHHSTFPPPHTPTQEFGTKLRSAMLSSYQSSIEQEAEILRHLERDRQLRTTSVRLTNQHHRITMTRRKNIRNQLAVWQMWQNFAPEGQVATVIDVEDVSLSLELPWQPNLVTNPTVAGYHLARYKAEQERARSVEEVADSAVDAKVLQRVKGGREGASWGLGPGLVAGAVACLHHNPEMHAELYLIELNHFTHQPTHPPNSLPTHPPTPHPPTPHAQVVVTYYEYQRRVLLRHVLESAQLSHGMATVLLGKLRQVVGLQRRAEKEAVAAAAVAGAVRRAGGRVTGGQA
jgi:hypothetical protein